MKTPATGTLTIPINPGESRTEYLLRCAAAFISAYAPEKQIIYADWDDKMTEAKGQDLSTECIELAEDHAKERAEEQEDQERSIEFTGNVVEAGNDSKGQPRMTISTSAEQLRNCGSIPFYLAANIVITPIKR